jgi:Emfourin
MLISLTRSGGLAGVPVEFSINTDDLPPEEASKLTDLTREAKLEDLAQRSPIGGRGYDRFQYDLTVEDAGRRVKVTVAEDAASPELKSLINRLLQDRRRDENPGKKSSIPKA